MKRLISTALAGLIGAVLTTTASATTVINVDFGQVGNHPGGVVSAVYTGPGAAFDPTGGTFWNDVIVSDNNAFQGAPGEFGFWSADVVASNLKNSQNVATSVGITLTADPANGTGAFGILQSAPNLNAVATNAVDLMRDYLISFNTPHQVTLNGFAPNTTMDLYLYGAGDSDNRDTVFTVTDSNGLHSGATTGTISPDPVGNPQAHVLTLGGDYVVLPGVKADGSGNVVINYQHSVGSGEGPFNGLQIVFGVKPGDVNGDNHVDLTDYGIIRDHFQATGVNRSLGDLTGPAGGNAGDGVVDFYDFAQWQSNFPLATANGVSSASGVPEPTALGLASLGAAFIVRRACRRHRSRRASS